MAFVRATVVENCFGSFVPNYLPDDDMWNDINDSWTEDLQGFLADMPGDLGLDCDMVELMQAVSLAGKSSGCSAIEHSHCFLGLEAREHGGCCRCTCSRQRTPRQRCAYAYE